MLKAIAKAFSFFSLLFLGLSLLVALQPKLAAQQWLPGGTGLPIVCGYSASPPAATSGTFIYAQCDVNGNLLTDSSGGGGGGTVNQGTGGASAWLVTGTGGTFPITASSLPLPTGAATSSLQSTGNGTLSTIATNTSSMIAASHASVTSLGTSLVAKASAGLLVGYNCTAITGGAAGYCIAYNGSSAPATGTLTGANVLDVCWFSGSAQGCSLNRVPGSASYSTGIVILVTTAATPFTYTTGTDTAYLSADYE